MKGKIKQEIELRSQLCAMSWVFVCCELSVGVYVCGWGSYKISAQTN